MTDSSRMARWVLVPLVVLVVGTIGSSAVLAGTLVSRGVSESHPSWIVLGAIAGALWTMALVKTVRMRLKVSRATAEPQG